MPCSKRKSLPQPNPPARIILLFMETQFCFPKLQIMLKKAHRKTLRKRWGEAGGGGQGARVFSPCCKARGTPLLTKNQTFSYCCSLYQDAPFSPPRSAALAICLKESSTNTSTDVFPLSFTLPCPKLDQLGTGDTAGSKDV